jgi:very-short-patch-repair endonuclease
VPREPRQFARQLRRAATPAEDALWQALRGRRLQGLKFKRQVPVLAYTVDFFCFDRKLVVEIDGRQHDTFAAYDTNRTAELEQQGLVVVRFRNEDVLNDLDTVLRTILAAAAGPQTVQVSPSPLPLSHPGEGRDLR